MTVPGKRLRDCRSLGTYVVYSRYLLLKEVVHTINENQVYLFTLCHICRWVPAIYLNYFI